ncbi:MAG: hypothetical protein KatS3mg057_2937 [Herpetosiphonaceae bacterium]|nr:MAG: hypothetical protein KatS3mg057_2937 [Herpetosiphonaceae bacterium]
MAVSITRRIFTVTEYERMVEAGILAEDDRVELLEGEILTMSPVGSRHVATVNRLNALLNRLVGAQCIVSVQNPIRLSQHSEPEPDIALLRSRADYYAHQLASPTDILLIIEVADTSLDYDRQVKIPLYAQAGIPEVWIVDLDHDCVIQFADLTGRTYGIVREVGHGQTVTAHSIKDITLPIEQILG